MRIKYTHQIARKDKEKSIERLEMKKRSQKEDKFCLVAYLSITIKFLGVFQHLVP